MQVGDPLPFGAFIFCRRSKVAGVGSVPGRRVAAPGIARGAAAHDVHMFLG